MPRKFNREWQTQIVRDAQEKHRAVEPGMPHDFTDEQIEGGLLGSWSDVDPRSGLAVEQVWKAQRDALPASELEQSPAPAPDAPSESIEPAPADTTQEVADQ